MSDRGGPGRTGDDVQAWHPPRPSKCWRACVGSAAGLSVEPDGEHTSATVEGSASCSDLPLYPFPLDPFPLDPDPHPINPDNPLNPSPSPTTFPKPFTPSLPTPTSRRRLQPTGCPLLEPVLAGRTERR
jgi:hypothetical protein